MPQIKQLGWAGAWVALSIFVLGFAAGSVYRSTVTPLAYSATPQREVTAVVPPLISSTVFVKLAEEVSGIRKAVSAMDARMARLEAGLRRR